MNAKEPAVREKKLDWPRKARPMFSAQSSAKSQSAKPPAFMALGFASSCHRPSPSYVPIAGVRWCTRRHLATTCRTRSESSVDRLDPSRRSRRGHCRHTRKALVAPSSARAGVEASPPGRCHPRRGRGQTRSRTWERPAFRAAPTERRVAARIMSTPGGSGGSSFEDALSTTRTATWPPGRARSRPHLGP